MDHVIAWTTRSMRMGRSDVILERPGTCTDCKYIAPHYYYGNHDFNSVLAAIVTSKHFED